MTTIKIISNPYKRLVEFHTFRQASEEWVPVNNEYNPGSRLISETIRTNFFPYKVNEIIDIIIKEYSTPNEKIEVIFEGSDDEYREIESVCRHNDLIELIRSEICMENARDILPKIIEIFNEIKPIVEESIQNEESKKDIDRNIAKLLDASSDMIPICVLGNYSSGKSTFINALIGAEILPSGDMPVTAKIYKIQQYHDSDTAVIDFDFLGKKVSVSISSESYALESEDDNELVSAIKGNLNLNEEQNLAIRVNGCLKTINKTREGVSDLINIQIPFADSPLSQSNKSFVIFDTPGSNAATHKDHFLILEEAMKDMCNGIPLYVAEYHTLDSCDNEILYEKIKSISQIDSRFTMIVVNKADKANIQVTEFNKSMEEDILKQAVPKNLYSGGIYFVSSIMGMGSKNNGDFINKYSEREYAKNHLDYENETSEWYQQLYKYNIMPQQIKDSIVNVSENSSNKIYANSGLLAIEKEIVNFAGKYSAYDKCQQSDKYIGLIVDATEKEIEETQNCQEALQVELQSELEKDKAALIQSVEDKSIELSDTFISEYNRYMQPCRDRECVEYSEDTLKAIEKGIQLNKQKEAGYFQKQENFKDSFNSIFSDISEVLRSKPVGEVFKTIGVDVKSTFADAQAMEKSRIDSDRATVDEFIRVVSKEFNDKGTAATREIDLFSRGYWEDNVTRTKEELSLLITNSATLDSEKKQELSKIIINYASVTFGEEHVFEKVKFEKKFKLPGITIHFNKINTRKLKDNYNRDFAEGISKISEELRESHYESFETWRNKLIAEIINNIVSYSPELSEQAKRIKEQQLIIEELKKTKSKLKDYSRQIQSLMDWK